MTKKDNGTDAPSVENDALKEIIQREKEVVMRRLIAKMKDAERPEALLDQLMDQIAELHAETNIRLGIVEELMVEDMKSDSEEATLKKGLLARWFPKFF